MKKLLPIVITTVALAVSACGSSEPSTKNDEKHINGMDSFTAALLCQKQVAKRAGIDKDSMVKVEYGEPSRKVRVGDSYHWHYSARDQAVPGGQYSCNIRPSDKDTAEIEVK